MQTEDLPRMRALSPDKNLLDRKKLKTMYEVRST